MGGGGRRAPAAPPSGSATVSGEGPKDILYLTSKQHSQQTQNNCIAFVQRRTKVDVVQILYKCFVFASWATGCRGLVYIVSMSEFIL